MIREKTPIAVLVSGGGTNLQAIIDAAAADHYAAKVVVVVSDRPGVKALDRAAAAGIPTVVVDWSDHPSRAAFTKAVCEVVREHGATAIALAGFMRVLSPHAIREFPNRILNIHPALLPAFPGADGVGDALAHGVKVSGVTVHFVDEEVDHGPIIFQEPVPVVAGDDGAALHARIQAVEHRVYPAVIDAFAQGRLITDGRTVHWEEPE